MNFLERALPLIQRGLFVISVSAPIPGDRASGKNPLIRDWQNHGTDHAKSRRPDFSQYWILASSQRL
jgi:hypothetical protein